MMARNEKNSANKVEGHTEEKVMGSCGGNDSKAPGGLKPA